jgi:hypothetical protein
MMGIPVLVIAVGTSIAKPLLAASNKCLEAAMERFNALTHKRRKQCPKPILGGMIKNTRTMKNVTKTNRVS